VSPKSACKSSWPTNAAAATPRARLPARLAARADGRAVSKYIKINPDDIKVNLERQDNLEVLEVKIEMGCKASPFQGWQVFSKSCLKNRSIQI
jgi:hypothetical protein